MGRDAAGNQTRSVWMDTTTGDLPPLAADLDADVCVIGAGIAGLTTAYRLARHGLDVLVIDDGPLGRGETGRTTAHLASAVDDRYAELERLHGADRARLVAESHATAIDTIAMIARDEGIDCGFARVDGWLFVPPGDDRSILDEELAAARRAGLTVELAPRAPFPDFDTGPALRFADQAQVHPLRYLAGLAAAVKRQGARLFSAHALSVTPERVETTGGRAITCRAAVVATCSPISDVLAMHTKLAAYRSYVIAARLPRGYLPPGLYWDTPDPYHYLRVDPGAGPEGGDLAILGGEDHKTGQDPAPQERWGRLEAWARERLPALGGIVRRWSGQVIEPVDGIAFIGPDPAHRTEPRRTSGAPLTATLRRAALSAAGGPAGRGEGVIARADAGGERPHGVGGAEPPPTVRRGVYIATGDSGNGMTHGTIAGILLGDLVAGRDHRWADLYDPSRKTLRSAKDYAKENLNVAAHYAQWATPGEAKDAEQVKPGCGMVVRRRLAKVAVHRDPAGALHERSAICPHLGCVVGWNAAESTWDCPCHGSRFDACGAVVNGPARTPLKSVD
jgi:glycine/D-amino acid oxidase-like deaminating enzyme/nitrite reductase/ring-hydroxylating ferredoxin subunit